MSVVLTYGHDATHAGGMSKKKGVRAGAPVPVLGRPIELDGPGKPWYELALACGGTLALATRLGVDEKTIRRWAHGQVVPAVLARKAVDALAREKSRGREVPLEPPFGGKYDPIAYPDRAPK